MLWAIAFLLAPLSAADPALRFESHIQPLLKQKCSACHSAAARQGGLSLDTRDDLLRGGKTGAAIVPGKPSDSILLSLVLSGKMPMGGARLSPAEITTLRDWIDSGALRQGETDPPRLSAEKDVFAAILGSKCFVCHGRRTQKAGLDLRSRESLLKGGKSGPAIVPGNPDASLLVQRIARQEMPPPKLQEQFSVRGLTDDEFEKLKLWIAAGAPPDNEKPLAVDPQSDPQVKDKDRQHWAFRPPSRPVPPSPRARALVRNPIDAFLLQALERKSLSFTPPASPLALMRRAYIDVTGIPPTPAEIEEFRNDTRPDAYERLIDRLLASPHYGERWSRYWLDAAGYADSDGAVSADSVRNHAWRYRDYVIRSLNADKPFHQFLTEQIAGDELFDYKAAKSYTPDQIDKLVATGFLRMGPDSTYSTEQNFFPERFDTIAAEIDILGTAVMGLTIGCARCHDHKYDPIPQRDYYRLSAILQTAYDPYDWKPPNNCLGVGANCGDDLIRLLPLHSPDEVEANKRHNEPILKRVAEIQKELADKAAGYREQLQAEKIARLPEDARAAFHAKPEARTEAQKALIEKHQKEVAVADKEILARFDDYRIESRRTNLKVRDERSKLRAEPRIRALFDMGGDPSPNRVLLRGDYMNPGPLVEPGPPSVLSAAIPPYRLEKPAFTTGTSGRRLALARWLTAPDHPLTARVMVNRIWQSHFGTGLVASPGNFGKTGLAPSHPELLDWLASEFVAGGWSIKRIHRLILTSTAYRQGSRVDDARQSADPDNRLLSRFPMRRMDADALRDSILSVAGRLDKQPFGPPVPINVKDDGEVVEDAPRRSIYLQQRRSRPVTMLETFDAPLLNPNCLRRPESTVSLQALQMMNSAIVLDSARFMAGRIIDAVGSDPASQIERLYLSALTRLPSPAETAAATRALKEMRSAWSRQLAAENLPEPVSHKAEWSALASLCHTILNSAEFAYVD